MTASRPELDPQLRSAFARAAEITASLGAPEPGVAGARRHAALSRRYWNEGGPQPAEVRETTIPGPTRAVPVVVYRVQRSDHPRPVFVYLHGGGFRIGNQWSNDRQMRELATAWGGIVISADYLHIPEHVFPAAIEETAAVLRWLHEHGTELGVDGARIAVGGTSAGAAVAFGAAVHLRGPQWLRAAVGIVGAFHGEATESMRLYGDVGLYPDAASVAATFDDYLPDPALREDPRANVLRADATLLPSTFLAAAQYDVFRDASLQLADRLRAAGRLATLKVYPGMAHLFFGFTRSVERSAECVRDIAAFLGRELGPDTSPTAASCGSQP
jgi:acetyl esterase